MLKRRKAIFNRMLRFSNLPSDKSKKCQAWCRPRNSMVEYWRVMSITLIRIQPLFYSVGFEPNTNSVMSLKRYISEQITLKSMLRKNVIGEKFLNNI